MKSDNEKKLQLEKIRERCFSLFIDSVHTETKQCPTNISGFMAKVEQTKRKISLSFDQIDKSNEFQMEIKVSFIELDSLKKK